MKTIETTLLVIDVGDSLLLSEKKRGFGKGKINGVGGKLMPGESVYAAMLRETREELNIFPLDAKEVGLIDFDEIMKGERSLVKMHIFLANSFLGDPQESDEVKPCFISKDNIPFDKMFKDDSFWLPKILSGKLVKGFFHYDENFNVLEYNLEEVDKL